MEPPQATQEVNFWRLKNLGDLELIQARYRNHRFPRHIHDEYIIGVIVEGAEEIDHRGTKHLAPRGSLILINPGEPHSNYSINDAVFGYRTFYPSANSLRKINQDISGKDELPLFSKLVIEQSFLFGPLLRLHKDIVGCESALEQESKWLSLMARLIAEHSSVEVPVSPTTGRHKYVKRVREFLESSYTEDLSLGQLAEIGGISPYHLLRTFHQEVGLPPFEYQNQLRISHAKKFLRRGWSIADTAAETGFVDQSHLTRQFKRIVGVTPGKYSSDRN